MQQTIYAEETRLEDALQDMREEGEFHAPATIVQADPFGGSYITAQAAPVKRNESTVLQMIKARANANGQLYFYSWEAKDNRTGKKTLIEGGSIKLANDLARLYGNCLVDTRSIDCGDHWMIYARFTDLETGFSMTRPYRQRKSQNVGKGFQKSGDADRALDMMMQIGTSKAIRNIIANSLSDLWVEAWTTAKGAIVKRVAENPVKAKEAVLALLDALKIDPLRAEMLLGRKVDKWTVQDIAKLWSTLSSIKDGLINAEDVFPDGSPEDGGPAPDGRNELDKFEQGQGEQQPAGKSSSPASTSQAQPQGSESSASTSTPASTSPAAETSVPSDSKTEPSSPSRAAKASKNTEASAPAVTVPTFLQKPNHDAETGEVKTPEAEQPKPQPITVPKIDLKSHDLTSVGGLNAASKALEKTMISEPIIALRREIFQQSGGDELVKLLGEKGMGAVASGLLKLIGQ